LQQGEKIRGCGAIEREDRTVTGETRRAPAKLKRKFRYQRKGAQETWWENKDVAVWLLL